MTLLLEVMLCFCYNNYQSYINPRGEHFMAQPKKQSSPRKTGLRRSHLVLKLARRVNAKSPVKVKTTKNETGKKLAKTA